MDSESFGREARKRLIDLGISQTDLSKKINIPRNRINDALAGRVEGRKHVKSIADFLGLKLDQPSDA